MRLCFERSRRDDLKTLHPAYFALVMATGIVAIATRLHGVSLVPTILFWLNNAVFFAALAAATAARIIRYPDAFSADVRSHSRGVGFFTVVAACGVFAHQLLLQMQAAGVAVFILDRRRRALSGDHVWRAHRAYRTGAETRFGRRA